MKHGKISTIGILALTVCLALSACHSNDDQPSPTSNTKAADKPPLGSDDPQPGQASTPSSGSDEQQAASDSYFDGEYVDHALSRTCNTQVKSTVGIKNAIQSFTLVFDESCYGDQHEFKFTCKQQTCSNPEGLLIKIGANNVFVISLSRPSNQDPLMTVYIPKPAQRGYEKSSGKESGGATILAGLSVLRKNNSFESKLSCAISLPTKNLSIPLTADANTIAGAQLSARFMINEDSNGTIVLNSYNQTEFTTLYTLAIAGAVQAADRWYSPNIPGTGILARQIAKSNIGYVARVLYQATVRIDTYREFNTSTIVSLRIRDLTESELSFGFDTSSNARSIRPVEMQAAYRRKDGREGKIPVKLDCTANF